MLSLQRLPPWGRRLGSCASYLALLLGQSLGRSAPGEWETLADSGVYCCLDQSDQIPTRRERNWMVTEEAHPRQTCLVRPRSVSRCCYYYCKRWCSVPPRPWSREAGAWRTGSAAPEHLHCVSHLPMEKAAAILRPDDSHPVLQELQPYFPQRTMIPRSRYPGLNSRSVSGLSVVVAWTLMCHCWFAQGA